jgi:hypothetical protein
MHHLILTEYLPYDSIVALRFTSSHFYSLVSPTTLKRLRQKIIAQLLADERALLQRWIPQPRGRYHGRPANVMACYSCLQFLPTTEFFAYLVGGSRGMGRSRARERWCKPCGIKYGKIRHGMWRREVSYSGIDQARHDIVMEEELTISNRCVTCPARDQYYGQPVWWGCVDCYEKEGKRLRKQDSERRRDFRSHCSKVKWGVRECVRLDNIREFGQDLKSWCSDHVRWAAMVNQAQSVYWWARDENLMERAYRTCGRVKRVLDPRQMQEPGQKLGRKARRAVGVMFDLRRKNQADEADSHAPNELSTAFVEDCIICCFSTTINPTATTDPTAITLTTIDPTSAANNEGATLQPHPAASPSPSPPRHPPAHFHIPTPRREVRCCQCWRAKRSRRHRRYDDGMAYGDPLPQERWCDGCQVEQLKFIVMGRERKAFREAARGGRGSVVPWCRRERVEDEGKRKAVVVEEVEEGVGDDDNDDDGGLGLEGLFGVG